MEYDVFICHASEDKNDFVEPLSAALKKSGLKVWYDRFELKLGDSLREKIDQGLANSRYGVVVLSKSFFAKEWPKSELDALVTRQNKEGKKVILPIWHNVNAEDVGNFSPILASKLAARSADGIEAVVAQIVNVCNESNSKSASVFQIGQSFGLREQCFEIIRLNDIVAWRKLINENTQNIPEQLTTWKQIGESAAHEGEEEWKSAVIEAAKICAPGFVPIFAAIEAGNKDFWKESLGILRRLSILEIEMGGGLTLALQIGNHMLYVVGTLGMSIATNLNLLNFVEDWMQLKMPERNGGEIPWLKIYSAHHLPEGIKYDAKKPFDFLESISNSEKLKCFFPNSVALVDNILITNLLCSLIELRVCSQDKECLDAFMNNSENFFFYVRPEWCRLTPEKFRIITLNLFRDSQGVIGFVYPSGFMTIDEFWPLWKSWKKNCMRFWSHFVFPPMISWLLLPGETQS